MAGISGAEKEENKTDNIQKSAREKNDRIEETGSHMNGNGELKHSSARN